MNDLQKAFETLNGKAAPYTTLYEYADGKQPVLYSTERLREAFRELNTHFQENWCAVVLDAALDRIALKGWDAQDNGKNAALDALWNAESVFLEADEAHRDALVTGEGFLIAWKDGERLDVYRNDPRMCAVFYDPARPKVKRFAAKWWFGDDDRWHMTLYYPERLEYYVSTGKERPSTYSGFQPAVPDRAPNPFGAVPVFHFRGPGELGLKVTTLQDAVNKLLADMMVAAEYGAFNQRYIISNAEDTSALKNAPNEIWTLPAGDGQGQQTSVGQFDATPLENYTRPMDRFANSIAVISRTPKHYFYHAGANLSGEALIAMEAPLSKKVEKYQKRFGVTWQEIGAFLLKLAGGGEITPSDVLPVWEPAESVQPYTEAQTRQLAVSSGIPLVTQLRRNEGWSENDIQSMLKDKKEEQAAQAQTLAQALIDRERAFNRGETDSRTESEE